MTSRTASTLSVPRWQLAAAILYAFSGGYGDASGYVFAQTFTGHVTGNLVLLALALPEGHWAQIAPRCVAITAFLAATAFGFLMVSWNKARAPRRSYLSCKPYCS